MGIVRIRKREVIPSRWCDYAASDGKEGTMSASGGEGYRIALISRAFLAVDGLA